jgi:hypothetical protein
MTLPRHRTVLKPMTVLKPIFIGFLLGFSLIGASRLSSGTEASRLSLSSTGAGTVPHPGAAFDRVSATGDCARSFLTLSPII